MPRTKKIEEVVTEPTSEPVASSKPSVQELMKTIADLTAQIEQLNKEKEEAHPKETVQEVQYVGSKMDVPCTLIHLLECTPSLPTTIVVNGREVPFSKFGEKRSFRFAEMQDICSRYRSWFERGVFTLGDDCAEFKDELGVELEKLPISVHKYNKIAQLPLEEFTSIVNRMSKGQAVALAKTWINRYESHISGYDKYEYVRVLNKKTGGFMAEFMSDLVKAQQ